MIERTYSSEQLEAYRTAGIQRAESERELLSLMFSGFSTIRLNRDTYDHVCMFNHACSLEKYTNIIRADLDCDYSGLPSEAKKYFHLIVGLNTLERNGLVRKSIWCTNDQSPEKGVENINDWREGSYRPTISWLARALVTNDAEQRRFDPVDYGATEEGCPPTFTLENIVYTLTTNGYDVAIKFFEHSNQEKQFGQQSTISDKAANAAASSAKTARIAIVAAFIIGLASAANVAVNLMIHFGCI